MELSEIKELMRAMERTGVSKISIKQKSYEIQIEREVPRAQETFFPHTPIFHHRPVSELEAGTVSYPLPTSGAANFIKDNTSSVSPAASSAQAPTANTRFITSPMVGTCYTKPSPDATAFIKVGDEVKEDTVVCIVEAMKVMNEVKAGVKGKVVEILISNEKPVEFGTKLFRIE